MNTQTAQIIPFKIESDEIRVVADDQGEPWFVAYDVCALLGYKNTSKAIADHCREKGITKRYTLTEKGEQELLYINEGNLYRLIIKCRLPVAERLEALVCDEILPTIRKTGRYEAPTTITPAQQLQLRRAVAKIAKGAPEKFGKVYHQLYAAFSIGKYEQLPAARFEDAIQFLAELEGEYLPKSGLVNALHELPKASPTEQIFSDQIKKAHVAFYKWYDAVKAKMPDVGWPDIDVNDLAVALIKDQMQDAKFCVRFDMNGQPEVALIPRNEIMTSADRLPDLIANGGAHVPKALLPKIIEAVAKRMQS